MDSETPDKADGVDVAEGGESAVLETEGRDKAKSVFERLWIASNIVGAIHKDGQVSGGGNYKFVSHDNVTARAKEVFAKIGIYHFATVLSMSQSGNRTTCEVELSFINVDDPSDKLTTKSFGHGVDNQDKGIGKAYSYAVKYGLTKALMLNTNEDIESHNLDYDDGQSSKVTAAKEETRDALEAWAGTFRVALTEAQSLDAIIGLEKENKARLTSANMPAVTRAFFIDLIQKRKEEFA